MWHVIRMLRWGVSILLLGMSLMALGKGRALDETFRVNGSLFFKNQEISIGKMAYDNYSRSTFAGPYNTVYDVKDWDHFTAYIGMDDTNPTTEKETVTIIVDGQEVWKNTCASGDKAFTVDIPLTGAKSLAISATANAIIIAEPKLSVGTPTPTNLIDQLVQTLITSQAAAIKANNTEIADLITAKFKELNIKVDVTEKATTWQFTK